ncbi:sigma-70 family RNA polymerase sigma factor [Kitasatospora sp. NPDC101447]|uniref:sigma-70 family RNA polymerase sigma factor n=1 Tax=Kitasatospora sp. NPDC101447 TaxID=3364102 RepID=UPI0038081EAA
MSVLPPPSRPLAGEAVHIPEGTPLHRTHHERRAPTMYSPVVAGLFGGGRFDATPEDPYPFLYAAFSPEIALWATLVRDTPFDDTAFRTIPRAAIRGRALAEVRTAEPLALLDLTTDAALTRVGASPALVHADSRDFVHTRAWAALLREHNPWAQGFLWPSRHPDRNLVVLFGDRCPENALTEVGSEPLSPALVNRLLARVGRPRPVGPPEEAMPTGEAPHIAGAPRQAPESDDFTAFFKANFRNVCRILNARHDDWELAQDAASRAFEIAYRRWPDVRAHPNPVGWVVLTGRRILIRVHQLQANRSLELTGDTDPKGAAEVADPAAATVEKVDVHAAIAALSRDKRECFVLHHVLHYPVADIAALLQIPAGTVKSRLSAARADLRDTLGHDFYKGGTR